MTRILAWMILLTALFTCACMGEEEITAYNSIEMSDLMEDVTALLGEGTPEGDYIVFADEVACAFYDSGRLIVKSLVFENLTEIAPVAEIPLEKLKKLKQGTHIDEIVNLMGGVEGLEIMCINLSDEDGAGVRRVLAWQNADKISVQALFELDDNEWVLFAIAESPAPNN